jgi:DNA-directed RNA polymerase specialized sigma24 family protein
VQDVFLTVWRDPHAYDAARGSFSSWLMAMVLHHKAVDAVRREESHRRRQARAEDDLVLSAPTSAATSRTTPGPAWWPSGCAPRSGRCPPPSGRR